MAAGHEAMRRMAEDALFKTGRVVELQRNIPTVVRQGKKETRLYSAAFGFALAHVQKEIVKILIGHNLVDLGPKRDALYKWALPF